MFLTVCLNPTIQKTIVLDTLRIDDVNRSPEHYLDISGKGINVSRVLVQLGEPVIHVTHAGGALKHFFLKRARREGLALKTASTRTPIRICVTLLQKQDGTTTEIVEDGPAVDAATEGKVRKNLYALIPRSRAVILSGSKAAGYSDALFPDTVRRARKAGKLVVCDYRGRDLIDSLACGPDIIKPNLTEFIETFFPACDRLARDPGILTMVEEKMRLLWHEHHGMCVLTDGGGPVLFCDHGHPRRLDPPRLHPVNTTGCGDAFTAGLTRAFLLSRNLEESVKAGVRCAVRNALTVRPGFMKEEPAGS